MHRLILPSIAFFSLSIALASYRFLPLGLGPAFDEMADHILNRRTAFLIHVILAPIALALGTFQFMPRLRQRYLALHRWSGRIYALACIGGGISGLVMALNAVGGPVAGWGFGLLAVLWIATTAQAVRLAIARDIARHREWMMRSFALTLAAVTLRLQLPFLLVGGLSYPDASVIVAWSCWVPNILLVQWVLSRRSTRLQAA